MFVSIIAAVLVAAAGGAAPAAETAAAASPEPAPVVAKKEKVVCRSVRTTGSRMPVRVCRTRGDWGKARDTAKRQAELMQERDMQVPSQNMGVPNCGTSRCDQR